MVERFSDLNYVNLTRIKRQDENFAGESAFEIWAATFGVKMNRYHADNGIFSEQTFRSEIEYANRTIKFCGVRSHHQNYIVEKKIQNLTIGYRTLLLHEKRYWTDSITKILQTYEL